jgi:hypothetical protein
MLVFFAVAIGACQELPGGEEAISSAVSKKCPPSVPDPSLNPPDGNKVAFSMDATGVQVYACQQPASGPAWVFVFPEANLSQDVKISVVHFAGPTWEALDMSTVVGTKVAGFTPDPTAIPWLLLSGSSHAGSGRMSDVTFIQRLNTVGGLAPPSVCDATTLGVVSRVPYTATYVFYKAGKTGSCD